MGGVVHVVGAGVAGLSAAVRLKAAAAEVVLHEATGQAGGRCRSYYDPTIDATIDNGNHVVLSGNRATLAYLRVIAAQDRLAGPREPAFPFVDLASRERWCVRPNAGRLPWWIFAAERRVPGSHALDYLGIARLAWAPPDRLLRDAMACHGLVYDRLWRPLLLAALNTDPTEASAGLAGAVVRETLAAGGDACRPLIAPQGLSCAFVDPAVSWLQAKGAALHFGHRLRAMTFNGEKVEALDFGDSLVRLRPGDGVILAVPPWVAQALVPGLRTPSAFRAIVNGHFRVTPPAGIATMTGVVNATVEWIFCFHDRISVTVSAADRLIDIPRETLARDLWREVVALTGVAAVLPPWQIIKERRATFAATPTEETKRPAAHTAWNNLVLAGDFTATGLPATIEGAIRSGNRAAELMTCNRRKPPAA
jgi:hydroxysqualene dehydroxylase